MDYRFREEKRHKQRLKKRRLFWFIIFPLILTLTGGLGYGTYLYNKAKAVANHAYTGLSRGEKSEKREKTVEPLEDNVSILIMGVDESESRQKQYGAAVRTDALLLATINKDDKSVKLLSIPRDTRVYIPSREKKDKINHAHVFGGVDSTIQAVEEFLDVPVDYYAKFNFASFIQIVDTLGGIHVNVPVAFSEQNSQDEADAIQLEKGYQLLNGEQALALARTRHIDSDVMRGQRQQLVLEAIAKKALSIESVNKFGRLFDVVGANMKTNLKFEEMMAIATNMAGTQLNMEKLQIEGEDKTINGIYYYVPYASSVNDVSETIQKHLGVSSKAEHATVQ